MTTDDPVILRRRKVHHLATRLNFTRDDRLEFARILLWRDVDSWSDLDDAEISRLLDGLEGYGLVAFIVTGGAWTDLPHPS